MIGGAERKTHSFAMDLTHSDDGFVQAYPAETTEAFCAGHAAAFDFFGGPMLKGMENRRHGLRASGTPAPPPRVCAGPLKTSAAPST